MLLVVVVVVPARTVFPSCIINKRSYTILFSNATMRILLFLF